MKRTEHLLESTDEVRFRLEVTMSNGSTTTRYSDWARDFYQGRGIDFRVFSTAALRNLAAEARPFNLYPVSARGYVEESRTQIHRVKTITERAELHAELLPPAPDWASA